MENPFPVECFPWASYVDTPDCLETSLLLNKWVNSSQLLEMSESDKKSLLVKRLSLRLDPLTHSVPELGQRPMVSEEGIGGLCGLTALQHAMGSTIASPSELRTLSYDTMRTLMMDEMLLPTKIARDLTDADLLMHFHDCG